MVDTEPRILQTLLYFKDPISVRHLALLLLLLLHGLFPFAQSDSLPQRFGSVTAKEFAQTNTDVKSEEKIQTANGSTEDIRKTPFNLIVYNSDHIRASGARDLLEFLRFVPGITMGQGTDGVIGLGLRGLWGHEGKYLIMCDGVPINEYDFGTFAFGHRIQLEHVSKIEILIGPGSITYGGGAALGVINVVMKSVSEIEGVFVRLQEGYSKGGPMRQTITLHGNHLTQNQTEISYLLNMGEGVRSMYPQTTHHGLVQSLSDSTSLKNSTAYVRVSNNGLSAKYLLNSYEFDVNGEDHSIQMRTNAVEFEYQKRINASNYVRTTINITDQLPWHYYNTTSPQRLQSNTNLTRGTWGVHSSHELGKRVRINNGVQAFIQHSEHMMRDSAMLTGKFRELTVRDFAFYSQLHFNSRLGSIDVGARWETANVTKPIFAPQLTYTLVREKFNAKFGVARSFKLPTSENINLAPANSDIYSEYVTTIDAQLGYTFIKALKVQLNLFDNVVRRPIVSIYDKDAPDHYTNSDRLETQGFECLLSYSSKKLVAHASFSMYRATFNNWPKEQAPYTSLNANEGLPTQKIAGFVSWNFSELSSVGFNTVYFGSSYARQQDSEGKVFLKRFDKVTMVDVYADFGFRKLSQMSIRIGCNNLMDTPWNVLPADGSWVDAFPVGNREFRIELQYNLAR